MCSGVSGEDQKGRAALSDLEGSRRGENYQVRVGVSVSYAFDSLDICAGATMLPNDACAIVFIF